MDTYCILCGAHEFEWCEDPNDDNNLTQDQLTYHIIALSKRIDELKTYLEVK